MATEFLCFYHSTYKSNLLRILKERRVMSPFERCLANVKADALYVANDGGGCPLSRFEFPGLYMNALPVHRAGTVRNSEEMEDIAIVFPIDILEQHNWHFNIIDQNGYINQNTFCKATEDQIPNMKNVIEFYEKTNKYYPGNELVFHDGIPIELVCEIWVTNRKTKKEVESIFKDCPNLKVLIKTKYPRKAIKAKKTQRKHLDYVVKPVLSYCIDSHYTGIQFPKYLTKSIKTPRSVYQKLADNAGVDKSLPNKDLDDGIFRRMIAMFKERQDPVHIPPFIKTK